MGYHHILLSLLFASSLKLIFGGTLIKFSINSANLDVIPSKNFAKSDGIVLYATCNAKKYEKEIDCTVIKRKLSLIVDSPRDKFCRLNLRLSQQKIFVRGSLELHQFEKSSKILVAWNELAKNSQTMSRNITIIDMLNCATTIKRYNFLYFKSVSSREKVFISNVVTYFDGFEVIISDKERCKSSVTCRTSFDLNGNRIGSSEPFSSNISYAKSESVSDYLNLTVGYFVSPSPKFQPNKFAADYVSASGIEVKLNTGYRNQFTTTKPITSTAHRLFTMCGTIIKGTLNCQQFRIGNSDPTINLTLSNLTNSRAVHNFEEGGFMLVSPLCQNRSSNSRNWNCTDYKLTMVDLNGKRKLLAIKEALELECKNVDDIMVAFSEDNQYIYSHFSCISEEQDKSGNRANSSLNFFIPRKSDMIIKDEMIF
ncbi:hypothetical protein QAD02_019402 [Eretmocerus hayati]|uniref:Uncharacterized protein n=1 Tax=Eretmocerus hayati TaxID=131215 RepID=A0ACC2PPA2_9HYME|nr:hypothetical protein QAD02_019402 [Eretmocerus hayati]